MLGSLVVAAFMVPAAIAYACNPQAHLSLGQTSYQPGQSITVNGSYFAGNATITVTGPVNSVVVKSSAGGAFTTALTAPSSPGNYTVTASRPTGGFAPASFSVAAPAPAAAAPAPATSAPAPTAAPRPATRAFKAPTVVRSSGTPTRTPTAVRTPARTTAPSTQSSAAPVVVPAPAVAGVTNTTGQPVFSGSVPVAAVAPARGQQTGAGRRTSSAPAAQAPVGQAALSDLYGNYRPGRTASLMNDAAGAPSGGTGSGLGLGIGLLAFGAFALVAGLSAAEVRRRRPTA